MARALIHMPSTAKRNDVLEIRALIGHPMETGYRPGPDGKPIPRDILTHFSCRYNGEVVFSAELHPAVSTNPYLAFTTVALDSGTLEFTWSGDQGFAQTERMTLTVTP